MTPSDKTHRRLFLTALGSLAGLAVALLLVLSPGRAAGPRPGEELLLPGPLPAPDFELTAHTGETVRMNDLVAGRVVVLFFGYTNCPDICPLTMAALGRARALLGPDTARVLGVLITVDPARDTPAALAAYVERFGPGLMGLTGTEEALAAVAEGYLARSAPAAGHDHAAPQDYIIEHTGRAFVVADGAVRMTFPPMTGAPEMADGLRLLLER